MSVRRSLFILTLLLLAVPAVVFSFRANQARLNTPGRNLQFYAVQRGDLAETITAIGTIEADATAQLSFTAPGRIAQVLVQPGDMVLTGDVLVRQVSDSQQIAYDQALLSLRLAELQKQDLMTLDEAEIRVAEANLVSAQGAYTGIVNAVSPEDLRAAELRYQQALQAIEDARRARSQADGGLSEEAYQLLDAQIGAATFNAEIARLQLESLRSSNSGQLGAAGARIAQAQRELERIKAGPTQAQIDRADIAIRQAQAQVEQAALALSRTALTAPFDGIVVAVNAEQGALFAPGMTAVELVDASPVHVTVQVDEIDVRQIREGMAVNVRLDALPGVDLPATLDQISLVGTNDNGVISYDARVTLKGDDPRVRVGMTAEAAVVVQERRDVLVVPNLYIRLDRDNDRAYVNLLQPDGALKEVEVKLGLRGQDNSEVVAGLNAGDVVASDLSSDRISFLGG